MSEAEGECFEAGAIEGMRWSQRQPFLSIAVVAAASTLATLVALLANWRAAEETFARMAMDSSGMQALRSAADAGQPIAHRSRRAQARCSWDHWSIELPSGGTITHNERRELQRIDVSSWGVSLTTPLHTALIALGEAQSVALLSALEHVPSSRSVDVALSFPAWAIALLLVLLGSAATLLLAVVAHSTFCTIAFFAVTFVAIAVVASRLLRATPYRARLGRDGVEMVTLLGRRFIRYSSIVEHWVHLRAMSESLPSSLEMALAQRSTGRVSFYGVPARLRSLHTQLSRAIEGYSAAMKQPDSTELRAQRGDRALATWSAERAFLSNGVYRSPALSTEPLGAVLDDPRATASQRIGAALALRVHGEEESATIRVVAEQTAQSPVRVAFEEVAEGELLDRSVDEATRKQQR